MRRIRILAAARSDLVDGYHFYERQAEGVGRYFLDTLYSDIESLQISAGVHTARFGHYQCMLSRRFPYAVYYRIVDDEVRIYAVLDCRRSPQRIRDRLSQHEES